MRLTEPPPHEHFPSSIHPSSLSEPTNPHNTPGPTNKTPPRKGAKSNRRETEPALTQARPELEKFRAALINGMIAKNLTASDVARLMWGSHVDKRGYTVAKGRDRMTHILAGASYPNPANIEKLANILGLTPADLAIEPDKATDAVTAARARNRATLGGRMTTNYDALLEAALPDNPNNLEPPRLSFVLAEPGYVYFALNGKLPLELATHLLLQYKQYALDAPPDTEKPGGKPTSPPTSPTTSPVIELLTQNEAARFLRCGISKIQMLRRTGQLPYLPGRPVLIRKEDIEKWLLAKIQSTNRLHTKCVPGRTPSTGLSAPPTSGAKPTDTGISASPGTSPAPKRNTGLTAYRHGRKTRTKPTGN